MLHVWEPVFLCVPCGSRVQNQVPRLDGKPSYLWNHLRSPSEIVPCIRKCPFTADVLMSRALSK